MGKKGSVNCSRYAQTVRDENHSLDISKISFHGRLALKTDSSSKLHTLLSPRGG
jgi:hypothetical protein